MPGRMFAPAVHQLPSGTRVSDTPSRRLAPRATMVRSNRATISQVAEHTTAVSIRPWAAGMTHGCAAMWPATTQFASLVTGEKWVKRVELR
jgi:hypothetical protein